MTYDVISLKRIKKDGAWELRYKIMRADGTRVKVGRVILDEYVAYELTEDSQALSFDDAVHAAKLFLEEEMADY